MDELETRELAYFVAVAETLHFGRAAERLSIAQPALSKAIRRLETRLGVVLLSRSSRHVSLTPAGEALLDEGRRALDAVRGAARAARRAADPGAALRLVINPGGDAMLLATILADYSRAADARSVEVLFGGADRVAQLRDGRADVALLYAPYDDLDGLAYEPLYAEERVAMLPGGHRLASRETLTMSELEADPLPRIDGVDPRAEETPSMEVSEIAALVALGRTIALLPRSLVEPVPVGLVCVPVIDAPRNEVVVAWLADNRSSPIEPFVRCASAATADLRPASAASPGGQRV